MEEALRIFELHELYHDNTLDEEGLNELGESIDKFVKAHARRLQRGLQPTVKTLGHSGLAAELWLAMIKTRRTLSEHTEQKAQSYLLSILKNLCIKEVTRQKREVDIIVQERVKDGDANKLAAYERAADRGPSPLEQLEHKAHAVQLEHAVTLIQEHFIPRMGRKDLIEAAPERLEQQIKRTFYQMSADEILGLSDDLNNQARQTERNRLNKNLERLRTKLRCIYQEELRAREQGSADVMPIKDDELALIGDILTLFMG